MKACTNAKKGQYYLGPAPGGSQTCPVKACKKCDNNKEHKEAGSCACSEVGGRKFVVVTGAGYTAANGVYVYTGVYKGHPAYCKGTNLKTTDKFTISKCGWNGGCGLLWYDNGWGWGIGCAGHHRYADPDCKGEQDPTNCKWAPKKGTNPRSGYAMDPIPAVHEFQSDLVVSGAGYTKANGVYHYSGMYKGKPAYCKGTGLKPTDSFTISKCGWNSGCGILWYSNGWGWGIGCDAHHRYADKGCAKEHDPTNCKWPVVAAYNPRPNYGKSPVPTVAHLRYTVTVSSAGYDKANGNYKYAGVYNGYPAFCKGTDLKPTDKFTISKCGWSAGCGLVYWSSHWGWGIGCEGHHRYSDPGCKHMDPARCKWAAKGGFNPRPQYGKNPLAKVHPRIVNKYMTVTGAGYTKVNGVYTYAGMYNGYPAYCKGTGLKPTDKFTISKCGWSAGCGLVMWSSHWGWGLGCAGHHRYADPGCKSFEPNGCAWHPKTGKDLNRTLKPDLTLCPVPLRKLGFNPRPLARIRL